MTQPSRKPDSMAESGDRMNYKEISGQQKWRRRRDEEDKEQKNFYLELNLYPNLFSLKSELRNKQKLQALLQRKKDELEDGLHQYNLETVRCHNLIIFLEYMLGRKQEAFRYCESLKIDTSKSVIFLTLKAVLQWDFGCKQECMNTLKVLQNLHKLQEYSYLLAVAEAEKGHLMICIGPKGFSTAMDSVQRAINACPGSDIYLWKYDLALVIRRNFNILAYSEHPKLAPSALASRAEELFSDISQNCPNKLYKTRSVLELARLISQLQVFSDTCEEEDKSTIDRLCQKHDVDEMFERVCSTQLEKVDHYILRECGRHFLSKKNLERAVSCFEKSCSIRETCMACQLFAKAYLQMYDRKYEFIKSDILKKQSHASSGGPFREDTKATIHGGSLPEAHSCGHSSNVLGELMEDSIEAKQMVKEMDTTPFMDAEGNFLTTQPSGFGNICHRPPGRAHSAEEKRLSEAFDKSTSYFMNPDGSLKTTQPENRIGNLSVPGHHGSNSKATLQEYTADEKRLSEEFDNSTSYFLNPDGNLKTTQPANRIGNLLVPGHRGSNSRATLQSSYSFPPAADGFHQRRAKSIWRDPSGTTMSAVLKCKLGKGYDASDVRVQEAESLFLRGFQLDRTNTSLVYDIGDLYLRSARPEKALEYYQLIISETDETDTIILVNAFERSGLCLINMSEKCQDPEERDRLKTRAEDMFMTSLVRCRRAVAHMPQISANRDKLWVSYPELLKILNQQGTDPSVLQKEARVHEMAGQHLEAIRVYQEVMELAKQTDDWTTALHGTVKNYLWTVSQPFALHHINQDLHRRVIRDGCLKAYAQFLLAAEVLKMDNIREAKFVLDLFFTEEPQLLLRPENDTAERLRDLAVTVYDRAGAAALRTDDVIIARDAFRLALLMKGRVVHPYLEDVSLQDYDAAAAADQSYQDTAIENEEKFDLCIFYDEAGEERLSEVASIVKATCVDIFGMSVSVNDEWGMLGRNYFDSLLNLAQSAPFVMLVVTSKVDLSPGMTYIADVTIESHDLNQIVLVDVADDPRPLPAILSRLRCFSDTSVLLENKAADIRKDAFCRLFRFLLNDAEQSP